MKLKATLFIYVPIIISKALVSCVTSPKERLWPSMTSIVIGVFFFMIVILCHCTSSLSMKHTYALQSSNVLFSIVMDLSYFVVIGNKKQGVGFKLGLFWTHDVSKSSFMIPIEIGCLHFSNLEEVACEWKWFKLYTIVVSWGN